MSFFWLTSFFDYLSVLTPIQFAYNLVQCFISPAGMVYIIHWMNIWRGIKHPHPTSVLDIILNNWMVGLKSWTIVQVHSKGDHIYPTPHLGQDMTQGQFFKAEFNRFEFRVFPSPRLVASPRLKNLVCPTIYP